MPSTLSVIRMVKMQRAKLCTATSKGPSPVQTTSSRMESNILFLVLVSIRLLADMKVSSKMKMYHCVHVLNHQSHGSNSQFILDIKRQGILRLSCYTYTHQETYPYLLCMPSYHQRKVAEFSGEKLCSFNWKKLTQSKLGTATSYACDCAQCC